MTRLPWWIVATLLLGCGGRDAMPTSPTPAPSSTVACTYTISPNPLILPAPGTLPKGTIQLTTGSACAWSLSAESWLTLSPSSGSGSSAITVSVVISNTDERSSTLSNGNKILGYVRQTNAVPASPGAPAPPAPSPSPAPSPGSALVTGLYVWGGSNYSQYLGFFTCVFCRESATDSINNEFGKYGNPFSSTSIRNQFSTYGSEFSASSPCNEYASNPPRVYDASRKTYYGELTLNSFRRDAIRVDTILRWLAGDVCRH